MSASGKKLECRRCHEQIPVNEKNCPHCGGPVRGDLGPMAAAVIGIVIILASATNPADLWVYALVGALMVGAGGWFVWEKRQRITSAEEETEVDSGLV